MFWVIKQIPGTWNLRLSKEGELEGLDIHEHGTPAYHMEFGYGMSYTTPAGLDRAGGIGMASVPGDRVRDRFRPSDATQTAGPGQRRPGPPASSTSSRLTIAATGDSQWHIW